MSTYTKFPELEDYLNDLSIHHFSHGAAFRQDRPSYIIRSLGYGAYESALDQIDEYAETLPEDEAIELWDKAAELRQYVAAAKKQKQSSKKESKMRNHRRAAIKEAIEDLDRVDTEDDLRAEGFDEDTIAAITHKPIFGEDDWDEDEDDYDVPYGAEDAFRDRVDSDMIDSGYMDDYINDDDDVDPSYWDGTEDDDDGENWSKTLSPDERRRGKARSFFPTDRHGKMKRAMNEAIEEEDWPSFWR